MILLTILLITAVVAALRSTGRGSRFGKAVAVLLFLFCWTPLSMLALRAVQSSYSRQPPQDQDAGAIVVLAGTVHDPFAPLPVPLLGHNTYERSRYAAWLHKEWRSLPVLASGGSPRAAQHQADSYAMREFLIHQDVAPSMIWVEDRSRSTAENASYSAAILNSKGIRKIVLVTDVVHMRRAQKCFEKLGFSVIPAPCGFRPVYEFEPHDALPDWRAISWNEEMLHEFLGLAWYWVRGAI